MIFYLKKTIYSNNVSQACTHLTTASQYMINRYIMDNCFYEKYIEAIEKTKLLVNNQIKLISNNVSLSDVITSDLYSNLSRALDFFKETTNKLEDFSLVKEGIKTLNSLLNKYKELEDFLRTHLINELTLSSSLVTLKDVEQYLTNKNISVTHLNQSYGDLIHLSDIEAEFYGILNIVSKGIDYLSIYDINNDIDLDFTPEQLDAEEAITSMKEEPFSIDALKNLIVNHLEAHGEIAHSYFVNDQNIGKTICYLSAFYSLRSTCDDEETICLNGKTYKIRVNFNNIKAKNKNKKNNKKYSMPEMVICKVDEE